MVSSRFLPTRIISTVLILAIFLLTGCASRHLVPVSNGGTINPELKSATKTEQGVTVTVQASGWRGKTGKLERHITPFYVMIQNNTPLSLTFDYEDMALLDENQIQYNTLPPETVAQILRASGQNRYGFFPYFSVGLGGGFGFGDGFSFLNLFFPVFYPRPAPERVDDVFTQALTPGTVHSNAKLQGFVYFKEIPDEVKRVTFEIGYELQGEGEPHRLSFPFVLK